MTTAKVDVQKALDWLNKHWKGDKVCSVCVNNSWTVSEEIVEIRGFHKGTPALGQLLYPLIVATCNTCGHTLLFNAVIAGLVKGQE